MGKTLAELAAETGKREQPESDRIAMQEQAAAIRNKQEEAEEISRLKESITQQLQAGNEPQFVLETALRCIGILTHDEAWQNESQEQLNSIYEDLAQQSLFTDNAAIAEHRLKEKTETYNAKLRKQLNRQLKAYRQIAKDLNGCLQDLDKAEGKDPTAEGDENGALDWTAEIGDGEER